MGENGLHLFDDDDSEKKVEEEKKEEIKTQSEVQTPEEQDDRYLFFTAGQSLMATPLLDVREVIEPVNSQEVPNTVAHFKGIANVRGEVLGIVDLAQMLKLESGSSEREALILFDTAHGALALLVEHIDSVQSIPPEQIELKPHIKSKVPQEYLLGIARQESGLVSIIQMKKILTDDDMITLRKKLAS